MSTLSDLLPAGSGGKNVDFVADGAINNAQAVALKTDGTVEAIATASSSATSPATFTTTSISASSQSDTVGNVSASVYDVNADRVIIFYGKQGPTRGLWAVAYTPTSTGLTSPGTEKLISSSGAECDRLCTVYDPSAQKSVVAYKRRVSGTTGPGNCVVVEVNPSTNTITTGSQTDFGYNSAYVNGIALAYDSKNSKVVINYGVSSNGYGETRVGTVSGTSISFSGYSIFSTGGAGLGGMGSAYDPHSDTITVTWPYVNNNYYAVVMVGRVSGNTVTWGGTRQTYDTANSFKKFAAVTDTVSNQVWTLQCFSADQGGRQCLLTPSHNGSSGSVTIGTPQNTGYYFYNYPVLGFSSVDNKLSAVAMSGASSVTYMVWYTVSGTATTYSSQHIGTEIPNGNESVGMSIISSTKQNIISYRGPTEIGRYYLGNPPNQTNASNFIGIADAAISDTATGSVTIKGGIATNASLPTLTPNSVYYVQADGTISTTSTSSAVRLGKALSSTSINLEFNS
jgi:hypothetical protein